MPAEIDIEHQIGARLRSHEIDGVIAALGDRQDGAVARWQLLPRKISRRAIQRRIEGGRLHVVYPGVYAVGHRKLSREGRWLAAVLSGGERAALFGESAAS